MTNDEIMQAAKDSYLDQLHLKRDGGKHYVLDLCYPEIERFATMIEKRTIERCVVVVEELRHPDGFSGENVDWCAGTDHAAAAIRKLGEQE